MRVDLHTHTLASDGDLAPRELFELQREAGTGLLAFTDHDTLAGWDQLQGADGVADCGLELLPGIEFSAAHEGREVHVVGLGFEADNASLRAAVAGQQQRRQLRAERIAERLEHLGVRGALEGATRLADGAVIGRPHFARFLVESGRVTNTESAFRRYLGRGKPAACAVQWPEMAAVIEWIRAAAGVAVLAHPLAYDLSRTRLKALVAQFAGQGGEAIEIALPGLDLGQMQNLAALATSHELRASAGSDFHLRAQFWRMPTRIPALPPGVEPVWEQWV